MILQSLVIARIRNTRLFIGAKPVPPGPCSQPSVASTNTPIAIDALVIATVAAGSQEQKPATAESEPKETIQEVGQEGLGGPSPRRVAVRLPQA
jgi:hypothetical protein